MSLSKKSKWSLLAAVGLILLIAGIAVGVLRLSPSTDTFAVISGETHR